MKQANGLQGECNVFFFEVGGQLFGADPLDVVRIDRPRPGRPLVFVVKTRESSRVLVIRGHAGEVQLAVDRVVGLKRVAEEQLRAAPAYLEEALRETKMAVLGALIEKEGSAPVMILDLKALSQEAGPRASEVVRNGQDVAGA